LISGVSGWNPSAPEAVTSMSRLSYGFPQAKLKSSMAIVFNRGLTAVL
jgi:hypothetical protein